MKGETAAVGQFILKCRVTEECSIAILLNRFSSLFWDKTELHFTVYILPRYVSCDLCVYYVLSKSCRVFTSPLKFLSSPPFSLASLYPSPPVCYKRRSICPRSLLFLFRQTKGCWERGSKGDKTRLNIRKGEEHTHKFPPKVFMLCKTSRRMEITLDSFFTLLTTSFLSAEFRLASILRLVSPARYIGFFLSHSGRARTHF